MLESALLLCPAMLSQCEAGIVFYLGICVFVCLPVCLYACLCVCMPVCLCRSRETADKD